MPHVEHAPGVGRSKIGIDPAQSRGARALLERSQGRLAKSAGVLCAI
jgi:hypothetical protein